MRAAAAVSASKIKGKYKKCRVPVGAPHARSTSSATTTANIHRPERAAMSMPTTLSGQNGSRTPAAASKKVIAYIQRLLCVIPLEIGNASHFRSYIDNSSNHTALISNGIMGRLFPDLDEA